MKYLLEGLLILIKYWPESTDGSAQHDVLYVGGEREKMSAEDVQMLLAIPCWHYNEGCECWQFNT